MEASCSQRRPASAVLSEGRVEIWSAATASQYRQGILGHETASVNRGHHAVPIVTEPARDWAVVDLRDILAFRELLYFLI